VADMVGPNVPARQQLMRTMNEQLLLDHIRRAGQVSRADLARISSLSKPTVSDVLVNLERSGLVRVSGTRTGVPGPAAVLYEIRPEAGFVLGLDVGRRWLRGALGDLAGTVRSRSSLKVPAEGGHSRVALLGQLADQLCAEVGIHRAGITQTVLGSPGVYDPQRDALALAGALASWERPRVLTQLRQEFGAELLMVNDVDAAALAERANGHGRDVESFAFVSVGTGIGMGLVLGGRLYRGAHGAAGEIGYLPLGEESGDARDARRRGTFEAAASAAGIVRAARRSGMRGPVSARNVFSAAGRGDARAAKIVADEALLVAKAICAVVTVADPDLIILGGGIGQAAGFLEAVRAELRHLAPVQPELRVSALGPDAVVDGCLAAGLDRAWELVTSTAAPPESTGAA
jgi:predicted NBD/HSP70 family sugar kinase